MPEFDLNDAAKKTEQCRVAWNWTKMLLRS